MLEGIYYFMVLIIMLMLQEQIDGDLDGMKMSQAYFRMEIRYQMMYMVV
jgi:hypothetical protein